MSKSGRKKLIIGLGAGRCGMRWFARLLDAHQNASGYCERYPFPESFYRYCKWHDLPIEQEGFFQLIDQGIQADWKSSDISFMVSPWFVTPCGDIIRRLKPDLLIFFLRNPKATVNSLYTKGWYDDPLISGQNGNISGLQPDLQDTPHHSFSRLMPRGPDLNPWLKLTRIGKITWYWTQINLTIYKMLQNNPDIPHWILKLEDIGDDYQYYKNLATTLDLKPLLSKWKYNLLRRSVLRGTKHRRNIDGWSETEIRDFQETAAPFQKIYNQLETTTEL